MVMYGNEKKAHEPVKKRNPFGFVTRFSDLQCIFLIKNNLGFLHKTISQI